jgi:hypothetical protein
VRTTHLGVSPDQFVSGGAEGVDTENEESSVPEAVCLSLQCLDLVICSFERPSGDGVIVVCQNAPPVGSQSVGEILEHTDTR